MMATTANKNGTCGYTPASHHPGHERERSAYDSLNSIREFLVCFHKCIILTGCWKRRLLPLDDVAGDCCQLVIMPSSRNCLCGTLETGRRDAIGPVSRGGVLVSGHTFQARHQLANFVFKHPGIVDGVEEAGNHLLPDDDILCGRRIIVVLVGIINNAARLDAERRGHGRYDNGLEGVVR